MTRKKYVAGISLLLAGLLAAGCSQSPSSSSKAPATSPTVADKSNSQPEAPLAGAPTEPSNQSEGDFSFYSVTKYDPEASAKDDLARTVKLASANGKHIILEIGGKW